MASGMAALFASVVLRENDCGAARGAFHRHRARRKFNFACNKNRLQKMPDHYAILGVKENATKHAIRKKYKRLALQFHPDKRKCQRNKLSTMTDEEAATKFAAIAQAHATLSNPIQRIKYDLQRGIRDSTDEEIVMLSKEKKRQALEDIHNMKHTVPIKRKDEESKNGLVIINGVYGKIKRDSDKKKKKRKPNRRASLSTLNEETAGEVSTMDATVPLQCMVDRSHLVIPAGESKAWLSGFYDPCLGEQKQLCVRYMFWGRLHEVTINDDEELKIPLKAHLLGPEVTFVSEGDDRGVIELLEEIYGRLCETRVTHRLFALTSFAALGMMPSMIQKLLTKYK